MLAAKLGARTLDLGNPQLSMHSIREMGGSKDVEFAVRLFEGLGDEYHLFWARRFCEMVKRDGRFVHRDGVLGR